MASGILRKGSTPLGSRSRACAGLLALTLGTTVISPVYAHAATNKTTTPVSKTSKSSDARYAALAKAQSTGQPVTIDSLTTADSTTQALPNGALAITTTIQPTRMKNSAGAWEAIDPTLVANPDGSISTTATPNKLTLSPGGTGPAISVTDPDGGTMALSLPINLPKPTLSGATATYTDVYPGVNLTVTAQPTGGFSEVFQVADPAADTDVDNLAFTTDLSGLSMSQGADGTLTVTDSSTGQPFLAAPPAAMWDSATTDAPATSVGDDFETTTNADSSAAGPGLGAHTGSLPVTASGDTLTLAADPGKLDTTTPTYPLYIDPSWSAPDNSGKRNDWEEAQSGCPTYNNWDDVSQPGAGEVTTNSSCPGAYRTFFNIDTSGLNSSDTIISSLLMINEVSSSVNDCGKGSETITIKTVNPINSGMDWDNQPGVVNTITSKSLEADGNESGTYCPGGTVAGNFDLKSEMQTVASRNYQNLTIGMYGTEGADLNTLERFNNNPSIYTVYDIPPNVPSVPTTGPPPVTSFTSSGDLNTNRCPENYSQPGYLGIANIGGSDAAQLTVTVTSQLAAAQMQGMFYFKDETTNTLIFDDHPSSASATTGGSVTTTATGLTDGHEYGWGAYAYDGYTNSDGDSAECFFTADLTPPTNPAITSTSFPPAGTNTTSPTVTGQSGTLTLAATDPAPASGSASGIEGFYYSFDSPVPTSGASFTTASGGKASVSYETYAWGSHVLYAQAVDKAGNRSAPTEYSFFVPQSTTPTNTNGGSITGGNIPDLITVTPDGNLVDYPANTDPQAAPTIVSVPADSPGGDAWNNYLVTHRGNFSNNSTGADDIWAFDKNTHELYLGKNNGNNPFENTANWGNAITKANITSDSFGTPCTPTAETDCTGYDSTDWNGLTQILATNDLYATDPVTTIPTTNAPFDLLTVENDALWLYQSNNGNSFYLKNPVKLGTTGWTNTTLIAPGPVGAKPGKPTLWARDDTTGKIYSYTITFGTDGYPNSLGAFGSTGTVIATGYTTSEYPALSSPGTLSGATGPSLYAVTNANHLDYHPWDSTTNTISTGDTYLGAIDSMTDRWALTDATCVQSAGSAGGNNNAYVHGSPTCGTPVLGRNAFTFNGSNYAETTSGPVIDTSKSYSISAWADPTTANHYGQIASLCGTNHCAMYLEENNSGEWEFAAENSDASSSTDVEIHTTTPVALNTWTHVVGVYNAGTGTLALYINATLVGTTTWSTPWKANSNFTIAGSDYTGGASGSFIGSISDVRAYQAALDQAEVTADYTPPYYGLINQLD